MPIGTNPPATTGSTDVNLSYLTPDSFFVDLSDPTGYTITLQSVDHDGNLKTTGGDRWVLHVQNECKTNSISWECLESPGAAQAYDTDFFVTMDDNADGSY